MSATGTMYPTIRTRIKICCMASFEEVQLAIQAGADAVGFVCAAPTSPSTIYKQSIASITSLIPPPISTFMLTSEPTASNIAQYVRITGASTVQIIPHLRLEESKQLTELIPATRRVQVIHIKNEGALDLIDKYAPYVHAFLLDSGQSMQSTPENGGTGRTHDWSMSAEFVRRSPHPVFLAGGLSPENVGEAMKQVRPFGVDLCSGVRVGGRLDPDKLKDFIDSVRRTDAELSLARCLRSMYPSIKGCVYQLNADDR